MLIRSEKVKGFFIDIIYALEFCAYVYWPAKGAYIYLEFRFEFIQNFEGVASLAVKFVDKNYNRSIPHAAYFHQFAGLLFDSFGNIDYDNDTIHGGQCPVCVFGKVLVTGSVQNIDLIIAVIESHHRCRYRDAALLFYLHPVACGRLLYFIGFDCSGDVDSASKEKQLFSKCRLAGVGMGNDCESTPTAYFFCDFRHYDNFCSSVLT